ncbi:hypothetical protein SMICM17S_06116 [Streptomyces microflavus]
MIRRHNAAITADESDSRSAQAEHLLEASGDRGAGRPFAASACTETCSARDARARSVSSAMPMKRNIGMWVSSTRKTSGAVPMVRGARAALAITRSMVASTAARVRPRP